MPTDDGQPRVTIRRCQVGEIDRVMRFIGENWQNDHVLAHNRQLMDWQHGTAEGDHNYIIALRDGRVLGVLGYIPTRHFDPTLVGRNVVWLALWKVQKNAGVSGLGLQLLDFLVRAEPNVALAVNGIKEEHRPIYRALRFEVGELKQHYLTNPSISRRIIVAPDGCSLPVPRPGAAVWTELNEDGLLGMNPAEVASPWLPQKTPAYFVQRFLRHPSYRYRVFSIRNHGTKAALIALRTANHAGGRAVRVVDFAGDPLAFAENGSAFEALMGAEHAEYADFWESGFPADILRSTGFVTVNPEGPVTVPTYFEPFISKNGRIRYAARSSRSTPFVCFRADGDQDRPSSLLPAA